MDTTVLAYIAGFLDGDGSIFFQLVRRKDYCLGYQVRTSIAFYQKTENERILLWLKEQFLSGYIRRRKTGISDYTIVAPEEVRKVKFRRLLMRRNWFRCANWSIDSKTSTIRRSEQSLPRQLRSF